jgi:hypothetical protein
LYYDHDKIFRQTLLKISLRIPAFDPGRSGVDGSKKETAKSQPRVVSVVFNVLHRTWSISRFAGAHMGEWISQKEAFSK